MARAKTRTLIGDKEVALIEVGMDNLVFKSNGQSYRFNRYNTPTKIVNSLAEKWFDKGNPVNEVYMATYFAMDTEGDRAKAREMWTAAARKGAGVKQLVDLLLPELDVPLAKP